METAEQLEQQLLRAASASDMGSIMSIVTSLTPKQKSGISRHVFDKALGSISCHIEPDPIVFSDAILTYLLVAGRYTSPNMVCKALQAMPRQSCVGSVH